MVLLSAVKLVSRMKIIVDYQKDTIFNNDIYGYIVNSFEYSINCFNRFKYQEVYEALNKIKENNKTSFLCIDKLIEENELDDFKKYVESFMGLFDYLIFSDLSVLNFVDESLYNKLLYDPKTLISSSNELKFYKDLGIDCFIANELSKDEILKMITNGAVINMMVTGRVLMMYSRRPLVSLYKEFSSNDLIEKNKDDSYFYYLKEELRDEFYPVVENENGTFIFSDYIYNALDFSKEIKEHINFLKISIDDFKSINESEGFLNKSSILLKGDKNE